MDRLDCMKVILNEYLFDKETYKRLDQKDAAHIRNNFKEEVRKLLFEYEVYLLYNEMRFFEKGFDKCYPMSQVYGIPKVNQIKYSTDSKIPFGPETNQCMIFSIIVS